jgi:hypothetical protein
MRLAVGGIASRLRIIDREGCGLPRRATSKRYYSIHRTHCPDQRT